ncbi:hypothetical protein JOC85_002709 [Bacillus mesophilus]|uniref:Uncharacterized protein n=1 Tax=Bacillus mesophilus TaxID=1808955 RepID=A0A6M0QCC0_9BACI|nr:hypothetical protein [Bacillus mesophilus]MBM7661902.1 hypothetical protein [Bacillus mesophilus]NEY72738.1 hypothetical protein [Bacillus mesophilus]
MRFVNFRICLCIFTLLFITGCSSAELDQVRDERNQLEKRVALLEKEIQQLRKSNNNGTHDGETLTLSYIENQQKHRFVDQNVPLLIQPHSEAQPLNEINANTVVEVHDYVDVNGELWLYVTIPVFDTPINMKGWIKETDTQLYTLEKQDQVTQPIILKVGTPVYKVELFNQTQAVETTELEMDQTCFVSDHQEEFLALGCVGGSSYIVNKAHVMYPEVK